MKRTKLLSVLMLLMFAVTASAQRVIDRLDRGLVAVKTTKGIFVSWRIQSDEYFDVTYNLYRDGNLVGQQLKTSNYTDLSGTGSSTYTVAPVVRGQEKEKCAAVNVWANDYLEVVPKHDPAIKSVLIPNDACCADVDGDGQVEILLKYDNESEMAQSYPKYGPKINGVDTKEYTIFECLKLDGTVLWWVNCGPNMGDFQNNEQNIIGYDWDMDGKAEALFRAADGTTVHAANGKTYVIGDANANYRGATGGGVNWFMHSGKEYLVYLEGSTGIPYEIGPASHPTYMDYPLPRLEASENPNGLVAGGDYDALVNSAWGDGYGHRSSKFFFGAPYLDGRHPSIFLGRGIYTQHKFITFDVDPATHKLKERWRWFHNNGGYWMWQGYHNYAIVDVDWDGRDEIVWGSMVIDDNGKGLSTSGLGHGDAQHHGDLDPYTWGQEGFFCNEDQPGNNLRSLTTSKILYRMTSGNDDGRAIMGNFSNSYPGCIGSSARDAGEAISSVTHDHLPGVGTGGMAQNFRCYWDGDLCEETFNYVNGKNTEGAINKWGQGVIKTLSGSMTNNDTKGTPSYMGDILGDWREEFIMRTAANNIRIYTTTMQTAYRNYSLWYDHQYRNGMVWQMCGYNQPPHTSYFLGELEGITSAPPALTMEGRTEVANGGTISGSDQTLITCETNDMTVAVQDGAAPYIYIDNTPSHVQGTAHQTYTDKEATIKYQYFTHTLTGGAFTGEMRLIKQGEGKLVMPTATHTYSGNTDVWGGTLQMDGELSNSALWLNRFASLNSDGGKFMNGIKADYASVIRPGGDDKTKASAIYTTDLALNFGSIVEIDIFGEGIVADMIYAKTMNIEKKRWPNGGGPAYDTPIFRVSAHAAPGADAIADGKYLIGEIDEITGDITNIVIEGLKMQKAELSYEDGKLYMIVTNYKQTPVTWIGDKSNIINLDNDANFVSDATGEESTFVTGSPITFGDNAVKYSLKVEGKVSPASITFNSSKAYTIDGDSILGGGELIKNGTGNLTIKNKNRIGNTTIKDGKITVASLANTIGNDYGSLGAVSRSITIQNGACLAVSANVTSNQNITMKDGEISVPNNVTFTQSGAIYGTASGVMTKSGSGSFNMPGTFTVGKLVIAGGTVNAWDGVHPKTIEITSGTYSDSNTMGSYSTTSANFVVPEGKSGGLILDPRCNYTGTLTGAGTFTVTAGGNRNYLQGNWSQFDGEIIVKGQKRSTYDPDFTWDNNFGIGRATLNVAANYAFNNNGKPVAVKSFKGVSTASGRLVGTGKYTVGAGYDGNITNYHTIESALDYKGEEGHEFIINTTTQGRISGIMTIYSGALRVTGSSVDSQRGVATKAGVIVQGTGTVYGSNAYFYSLQAKDGGKISVIGTANIPTTITTQKTTYIRQNGVLDLKISSAYSYSKFVSEESLIFQSGAKVTVSLDNAYAPKVGDKFTLWSGAKISGCTDANVTVELPALPAGFKWDASELLSADGASGGVLTVVKDEASAVSNLPASAPVTIDVYTTDGQMLGTVNTVKGAVNAAVKKLAGVGGTYIVRFRNEALVEEKTISVK